MTIIKKVINIIVISLKNIVTVEHSHNECVCMRKREKIVCVSVTEENFWCAVRMAYACKTFVTLRIINNCKWFTKLVDFIGFNVFVNKKE